MAKVLYKFTINKIAQIEEEKTIQNDINKNN